MPDRGRKIQQRAYEIWERSGFLHGAELEHWLEAERQISEEMQAAILDEAEKAEISGANGSASEAAAPAETAKPVKTAAKASSREDGTKSKSRNSKASPAKLKAGDPGKGAEKPPAKAGKAAAVKSRSEKKAKTASKDVSTEA